MSDAWAPIEGAPRRALTELMAEDGRLDRLRVEEGGILFDFTKTHLDGALVDGFVRLAEAMDLHGARERLFGGEVVNPSENRAAEHTAERGQGHPDAVARANAAKARMRALIDAIDADALGPMAGVLHIGIGGSALGPKLVVDALARDQARWDVAVVANVDGAALEEATDGLDPQTTLVAIASKTFTTAETMLNARSALDWLAANDVPDPYGRVIALTAKPAAAVEFGVDETRVLPFAESVGGRYSLWSTIGFPAALAMGWEAWEQLLEGAAAMDRHFRLAPPERNVPVLAAFADLYYAQVRRCETRATFAYDERLRLLPSYLQQLEMESIGKSVTADGRALGRPSAPITWGGVGTEAQHAVFQLLHQGTRLVPVEFVAVAEGGDAQDPEHHRQLLLNAFAQGAALMTGRAAEDPQRSYPGDRPSTTILLDRLDPATLGALLAFYEHRTFVSAALLGINPFDQFGVELGKEMANALSGGEGGDFDPGTAALMQRALGE